LQSKSAATGENDADTRGAPPRSILSYSWADDSRRFVKVYVSAEQEPAAVRAAGAESDGRVRAKFREQSFQVTVDGEAESYQLAIAALEHKIVPEECKVKVVEGRRIAIVLRKAKDDSLWNTLVRHC